MNISHSIHKYQKNPLITGTILLTVAGLLSRIIGFFYRIFLSRKIGAESLGLYQLTFPVLALCLSLTSSGIQTALSRFVAENRHRPGHIMRFFRMALFLSCSLCIACGSLIRCNSVWIAQRILGDIRCAPILSIMVYTLIPACIHACINGYYYGLKRAAVPAGSQLAEQIARVGGVYLIFLIRQEQGCSITASHAMWGAVIGEIFGLAYSLTAMWIHRLKGISPAAGKADGLSRRRALMLLGSMAIPLTFNRVIINICSSIENLLIPQRLCLSGLSQSNALSVYGILSGMAMSIILFPNALTGSLSVLLLPAVSEANAAGREHSIVSATQKAVLYGLLLGFGFTFLFLLTGNFIGIRIFNSALAGAFIRQLSWLCPFMYISAMLGSILHGLGRPKTVLFINLLSCLIRIVFVLFLVPKYGINAYLWSMLVSQVFCALASMVPLRRYLI